MYKNETPYGVVWHWDGPAEMASAAQSKLKDYEQNCDKDWTGEDWPEAVANAMRGRTEFVAAAQKLLDEVSFQLDTPKTEWVAAQCGAYPVVPDALCGHPDSMRRKRQACDDVSPIRIFVDNTGSAGISAQMLMKRGTVYLALAMALSTVRPVELYVSNCIGFRGTSINVIRLGTSPLDMATVCNALCSVGLARGLGYSWSIANCNSDGRWPWNIRPVVEKDKAEWVRRYKAAVGCGDNDLVVPPMHLYDECVTKPVEFLKRAVAQYATREDQ